MASEPRWHATAYWTTAPGHGELRRQELREPQADEALVRTLYSGISRGTELLVHRGGVPPEVAERMRAPFQEGALPGPVKYGYLNVGHVEAGPDDVRGRTVFCLYPHQDRYVVPATALTPVPDGVPPDRAVLAGTVETAVNAVWDGAPRLGDRVAVIGAGMVGAAVAGVLRTFPLERLELVDVDESRRAVADRLGVTFSTPADASDGCDVVFHASASGAGLSRGLELLGEEGELIELSWYGDRQIAVDLGGSFHARRLRITASQVGAVARSRRARRSYAQRMALALEILRDDAFNALLSGHVPFGDLPQTMNRLAQGDLNALCYVVNYP